MSKLRENIEKVLGNSIRCLLPSYWWKRLFGMVVDEIDDVRNTANSKANKSEVASLSNSIDALSDKVDKIDSGNNITVDSSLSTTSTNPVQNKVVTEAIKNVVPTFGITKTQGFAEYFLALSANQSNSNMYPRGIVIYENAQSEVDNVIGLNNGTEIGIEFSVAEKRYRWVFNRASSAFIREEEVSSESSSGIPIYVALQGAVLTDEQIAANKYALENKYKEIPYVVYIINSNGENYTIKYPIVQWGGNVFYVTDWDDGNPFSLLKHTINSDGSVTYEGRVQADSEMSDTSTNPVQNKVVTEKLTELSAEVDKKQEALVSGENIKTINGTTLLGSGDIKVAADVTIDTSLSSSSTNPVQNKVVTDAINDKADKTDIKTLNGVSLLGGGNLQLGDGETIVYDDTEAWATIDSIYEEMDKIWDYVNAITDDVSDAFDDYDKIIYDAEYSALNAAYELKVTEGHSLKGSAEFKDFLDQTCRDQYSYYVITDVESEDGTDDWEIILRSWNMNPTEHSIKKTDLPYSVPWVGFETIGSYCTTNVKDFKVYHPLMYENKKLKELTASLESRIAALEGNQTV